MYNDLKLPKDSNSRDANKSYGFINFRHPLFLHEFYKEYQDTLWPLYDSMKRIDLYFAD